MTKQEVAARFYIYKLGEKERVESFDCGDADLNDFILNDALPYHKEKLAVTYTYVEKGNPDNVAAIPFYLKNGFVPLNDEDADEPTRLLYFDLNDLDEE
ncbi:MAG: hypothetical protein IJP70_00355 [Bacteroidales bacterium]|nr:hypothetical protein [Bacteroidales bacterium]